MKNFPVKNEKISASKWNFFGIKFAKFCGNSNPKNFN
jgi:hypothetical protein